MASKVIAIGIDAAELPVIEREVAAGRLPAFARILDQGLTTRIASASKVGSGSVWPTFVSGSPPEAHGRYAEWLWSPGEMSVRRMSGEGLVPFWLGLARDGARVLTLDIPYAPFTQADNVFEILEWGAHDIDTGAMRMHPASLRRVVDGVDMHPYRIPLPVSAGPDDRDSVAEVGRASVTGAELRGELILRLLEEVDPDLAVVVFPELHHAGHDMWHTYEPEHPHYDFPRYRPTMDIRPNLLDVYEAVDHQVGRIVDALDSGTSIFVFALHGLRAAPGVVTMMNRFLWTNGYATRPTLRSLDPTARRRHIVRSLKRRAPAWARALYQRRVDQMTRIRLAEATMFETPDFTTTRAFGLPVEWHGYGRINLKGREAAGAVELSAYADLRAEIDEGIRGLVDVEGRPLVQDTYLSDADPGGLRIPDVIVHWLSLAHNDAVVPREPDMASPKIGLQRTAEHTLDAFCLSLGPARGMMPEMVDSTGLGSLMRKALGV